MVICWYTTEEEEEGEETASRAAGTQRAEEGVWSACELVFFSRVFLLQRRGRRSSAEWRTDSHLCSE